MQSVLVGQPNLAEGYQNDVRRQGRDGDIIVSKLHGDYLEQNRRGNVYCYNSGAAGITILKYDNTGPALVLWNKSQAYSLELIEFSISWGDTPAVAGHIGLGIIPPFAITVGAAGSTISAFTELATVRRMKDLAAVNPPNGKCATTSTIAALAAAALFPIFSLPDALAAASTTTPLFELSHQFRGDFLLPPMAALVVCGNVAQTAAMGVRLSWIDNVPAL